MSLPGSIANSLMGDMLDGWIGSKVRRARVSTPSKLGFPTMLLSKKSRTGHSWDDCANTSGPHGIKSPHPHSRNR